MDPPYKVFQRNNNGLRTGFVVIKAEAESAAQGSLPCAEFFINRHNPEDVQLKRAEHFCAVLNGKML